MIEITPDEAIVFANALAVESAKLAEAADKEPLRTDDPETQRYELKDQAQRLRERSREIRIQATDALAAAR